MDNSKNGLPCLNHHPTPLGQQSQTQWRTNRRRRRPVLPMTMPLSLAGVGGGGGGGLKARGAARAGTCRSPALSPWLRPITMPVRWTGSGCRVRGAASPSITKLRLKLLLKQNHEEKCFNRGMFFIFWF